MYIHVKPEDCEEILEKTVLGGEIIDRPVYKLDGVAYPRQEDIPFYKRQNRVVLRTAVLPMQKTLRSILQRAAMPVLRRLCLR